MTMVGAEYVVLFRTESMLVQFAFKKLSDRSFFDMSTISCHTWDSRPKNFPPVNKMSRITCRHHESVKGRLESVVLQVY
jgi:hypothetical protein